MIMGYQILTQHPVALDGQEGKVRADGQTKAKSEKSFLSNKFSWLLEPSPNRNNFFLLISHKHSAAGQSCVAVISM